MKRRHDTGQKFVEAKYIYCPIIISMKTYKFKLKPSPKIVATTYG